MLSENMPGPHKEVYVTATFEQSSSFTTSKSFLSVLFVFRNGENKIGHIEQHDHMPNI